jgi:hypothetical protein
VSIDPFNTRYLQFLLQIRMLVRLTPALGGDGTIHHITVLNDTGSGIMTLLSTDLLQLGNLQVYTGWLAPTRVTDANGGSVVFRTLNVQVQLVRNNNTPWGAWIPERAIVKQLLPGVPRLSGGGIRRVFFMGTAPAYNVLAVSATKGGLASLL